MKAGILQQDPNQQKNVRTAPKRVSNTPKVTASRGNSDGSIAEKENNQPAKAEQTVGRNEPCPCGSGKKFKQCHGKAYA